MVVHVIVDASGSMVEDSKRGIVKYILVGMEHVHQWTNFSSCEYKVYQIGEKTGYIGTLESYENMDLSVALSLKNTFNNLVCIGLGADINRSILKRLSHLKKVYNATDYIEVMGLMR